MVIIKALNKLLGDPNEKALKALRPSVEQINEIEKSYQSELTAEKIREKTAEFKERLELHLENPETLRQAIEKLLPEAFALVKFACRQLMGKTIEVRGHPTPWEMTPYDVQILGALVLHQGKIAEMKTGEGKTLVCTLPVYLNALTGKGVHVVTVNDYLAHRDAEWMGDLYRLLGLTVGVISHGQNRQEKQAAYAADITYGTNNEFGFDYLRDNMATRLENLVQRGLHYAIVDEVDSILIDEARTPLIISAPAEESTDKYLKYARLVNQLEENVHYTIDEKAKTAVLSEEGIRRMEELMGVENIYTEAGFEEVHHIECALKAQTVYKNDIDYVVKEGNVVIVDEFTGRLMEGRRYSQGLHQAIEAKENVAIKRESRTLATITFQNYFRLYEKLAGMTGTAVTEAEEFGTIYGLDTIVVPTHHPIGRCDSADVIYKNTCGKFSAIVKKIKELYEKGQPVLIGTISIEKSEMLSKLLALEGIKHNVLNAKHHEREAEIIAKAGQEGAVTIATNMAGRGTDIKLGKGVVELGGLYVIGTERHESRRIDNQLRGRSGRQGDPGTSQFYISMEDDLMRLFGSERIKNIMEKLGIPEDLPIENGFISRSIENAQKRVEGHNFDIRKHLVEYDTVMNKHREIMYRKRHNILEKENIREEMFAMIKEEANRIVMSHADLESKERWNYRAMAEMLSAMHRDSEHQLREEELRAHEKSDELVQIAQTFLEKEYLEKENKIIGNPIKNVSTSGLVGPEGDTSASRLIMRHMERAVALRVVDTLWMQHIDEISKLRERVALRGYGQRDPLIEYKSEAFQMFTELNTQIQQQTVSTLFKVKIQAIPATKMPAENMTSTNFVSGAPTEDSRSHSTLDPVKVIKATPSREETNKKPTGTGRNDPCPCGSGKKYKKCCQP